MDGVDTSVLVRYLLADEPVAAGAAARLLDSDAPIAISLVALAETAFVLHRNYGVPRELVVDRLVELLRKQNVTTIGADKGLVAGALLLCRPSGRVSFADALINADLRAAGLTAIFTFDERFPPEGLSVRRLA
jgi:predicted nucleic-acid-binding protein